MRWDEKDIANISKTNGLLTAIIFFILQHHPYMYTGV